jgi:hypothetical protein
MPGIPVGGNTSARPHLYLVDKIQRLNPFGYPFGASACESEACAMESQSLFHGPIVDDFRRWLRTVTLHKSTSGAPKSSCSRPTGWARTRSCAGRPSQRPGDGFFTKLSKRRLKRVVFVSVVDLQAAIDRFVVEHNIKPKPFTWTADPDKIIRAVRRGHQVLDSHH